MGSLVLQATPNKLARCQEGKEKLLDHDLIDDRAVAGYHVKKQYYSTTDSVDQVHSCEAEYAQLVIPQNCVQTQDSVQIETNHFVVVGALQMNARGLLIC